MFHLISQQSPYSYALWYSECVVLRVQISALLSDSGREAKGASVSAAPRPPSGAMRRAPLAAPSAVGSDSAVLSGSGSSGSLRISDECMSTLELVQERANSSAPSCRSASISVLSCGTASISTPRCESASSAALHCGSSASSTISCGDESAVKRTEAYTRGKLRAPHQVAACLPSDRHHFAMSLDQMAQGHDVYAELVAIQKLVPFGWWRPGEFRVLPRPQLHSTPSLGIILRQAQGATPSMRSSALVPHREVVVAHRYGTPRGFFCTHVTSRALTKRNKSELPTILRHDEQHLAAVGAEECWKRVVASPEVVEWLMGVPQGWTEIEPLAWEFVAASVSAAAAPEWPGPKQQATLSLFSGCGMLDFGLAAWSRPVAYCELCDHAVTVLRARMSDGTLHAAPVHRDIKSMSATHLRGQVAGIVMGFPCQDISVAGRQQGFAGEHSILVFEALRLADEVQCAWIFLENVSHIRGMPEVWRPLFQSLGSRGFNVQWCTLEASHVGSPQTRRRWFALARRERVGVSATLRSANAAPLNVRKDARFASFINQSGARFNGGRPPPDKWLLPIVESPAAQARLHMLGLGVVPLQARLAAFLLDL